ncbi:MAG: hypothetical protein RML40_11350 [Bacteroidota bacterium]|nr:hypothetical protein [Candidatus Kapabacteria bacterium]MDW8221111.1 hypothetical protein [Bacteroidota bacterium]
MGKRLHRGEVWFLRLCEDDTPSLGLVVSREDEDGIMPMVAVVPYEPREAATEFDAPVSTRFIGEGVFNVQRLTAVRPEQFLHQLGVVLPADMDEVERCLYRWLDL